ncbi:MAG TPA: hypothetical protein VHY91_01385 [Pirellulales bacterium]|jgi:hypothetical protein|nr:hypothetical protein [Pirellulales bacterium]
MKVEPIHDHGQTLPVPQGRAIGFVDTKEQCEAIVRALNAAGYADSKITILYGDEGVHLLKRLEGFYFSDAELGLVKFSEQQLRLGHYGLAIEVEDRDEAVRVTNLSTPLGGHSFDYFGTWFNERLTR